MQGYSSPIMSPCRTILDDWGPQGPWGPPQPTARLSFACHIRRLLALTSDHVRGPIGPTSELNQLKTGSVSGMASEGTPCSSRSMPEHSHMTWARRVYGAPPADGRQHEPRHVQGIPRATMSVGALILMTSGPQGHGKTRHRPTAKVGASPLTRPCLAGLSWYATR